MSEQTTRLLDAWEAGEMIDVDRAMQCVESLARDNSRLTQEREQTEEVVADMVRQVVEGRDENALLTRERDELKLLLDGARILQEETSAALKRARIEHGNLTEARDEARAILAAKEGRVKGIVDESLARQLGDARQELKKTRTAADVATGDLALAARNLRRAAEDLRALGAEDRAKDWEDAAEEMEQARANLITEAGL